jgi:hypothetical protein
MGVQASFSNERTVKNVRLLAMGVTRRLRFALKICAQKQ